MSSRATDAEFDTWLCAAPATLSTEQLGRTVETLCPSSLAGFLAVLEAACTARRRLNGMEFGNLDPDGRAACKVTDALGEVASALFFPVVPASPAQRRTASAVRDAPAGAGAASPAEQPGGSARYCQSTGGWSTGPGVGGYGSWSNPAVAPYLRHMSEGFSAFFAGDGGRRGMLRAVLDSEAHRAQVDEIFTDRWRQACEELKELSVHLKLLGNITDTIWDGPLRLTCGPRHGARPGHSSNRCCRATI